MAEPEKTQTGPAPAHETVTGVAHGNETEEAYTSDIKGAIQTADHDDAADIFAGSDEVFQYTDSEASVVRWKLDLILLPIVSKHTFHAFPSDGVLRYFEHVANI